VAVRFLYLSWTDVDCFNSFYLLHNTSPCVRFYHKYICHFPWHAITGGCKQNVQYRTPAWIRHYGAIIDCTRRPCDGSGNDLGQIGRVARPTGVARLYRTHSAFSVPGAAFVGLLSCYPTGSLICGRCVTAANQQLFFRPHNARSRHRRDKVHVK